MRQIAIDFGPDERARDHDEQLMRALVEAVRAVTADRLCMRANVQPSVLSEAINGPRPGRPERPWQQRWTNALLDMPELADDKKVAILDALAARCGRKTSPRRPLTDRERLEKALAKLRKFGEPGVAAAREVEE
jgi:hypothetical protein